MTQITFIIMLEHSQWRQQNSINFFLLESHLLFLLSTFLGTQYNKFSIFFFFFFVFLFNIIFYFFLYLFFNCHSSLSLSLSTTNILSSPPPSKSTPPLPNKNPNSRILPIQTFPFTQIQWLRGSLCEKEL